MAGGESSRLGREKAFINYHGKPQVLHLHQMLKSLQLEVYISCRRGQVAQFRDICPLIIDQGPSVGPMGGIFAALSTGAVHDWLVVACDMPLVSVQTFQNLLANHRGSPVTTYKDENKAFPEVLLTIYGGGCFSSFQQAISDKSYSLQSLLKTVNTRFVPPANEQELMNVNTLEGLKKAMRLVRKDDQ